MFTTEGGQMVDSVSLTFQGPYRYPGSSEAWHLYDAEYILYWYSLDVDGVGYQPGKIPWDAPSIYCYTWKERRHVECNVANLFAVGKCGSNSRLTPFE